MELNTISKFVVFKQKYIYCSAGYFILNTSALSSLSSDTHSQYLFGIYIYIYMCVCVCVCVCTPNLVSLAGYNTRSFKTEFKKFRFIVFLLYCHLQHHNDTIIKTQEDFFINICTSHFIVRFVCERELETEQKLQYFDPHSYGRQRCVFLVLQDFSTGGPEAHSARWWLSLLHLISIFSGPQLIRVPMAPPAWCGFPYHNSSITPSLSNWNSKYLTSVLTGLYNSSTSTQLPTRFLESQVGSSSSGNNCHVVHRLVSSGASVYECTMGIFLPRPISSANFRPRDFLSQLQIRMCHLLPVHHIGMAFLAGSKAKIQHSFFKTGCHTEVKKSRQLEGE